MCASEGLRERVCTRVDASWIVSAGKRANACANVHTYGLSAAAAKGGERVAGHAHLYVSEEERGRGEDCRLRDRAQAKES